MSVAVNPASIVAQGNTTLTATVRVGGVAASGKTVTWSADDQSNITFANASNTTNTSGIASVTVTHTQAGVGTDLELFGTVDGVKSTAARLTVTTSRANEEEVVAEPVVEVKTRKARKAK